MASVILEHDSADVSVVRAARCCTRCGGGPQACATFQPAKGRALSLCARCWASFAPVVFQALAAPGREVPAEAASSPAPASSWALEEAQALLELGMLEHEALGVEDALRAACSPAGPELTAPQAFWLVWFRDHLQGVLSANKGADGAG